MEEKLLEHLRIALGYLEDNEALENPDLVKCGRVIGLAISELVRCEELLIQK